MTRERIIEAASELITRNGYAKTSLDAIAAHMGKSKGALYFHFDSKEDLARAVVDEQHARAMAAATRVLDGGGDPLRMIAQLCRTFSEMLLDDPVTQAGILLTTDTISLTFPEREPYQDWMDVVTRLLAEGQASGRLVDDFEPGRVAWYICASFTGVQLVSATLTDRADQHDRVAEMWRIMVPSLVAPDDVADARAAVAEVTRGAGPE
ncbi:ScbR family autoregulator-binding transcription factor [Paramicrobacterium sp. CJ85]|uniref:ScbR family autoregulator-binding transcription factor n=1 Tax=Paramicrobacterium sp. CJ85 TaxID=3445355 RepID=UPI003F634522